MKNVKIEDIAKITSGFAFPSDLFTDDATQMPLIRIRDVSDGYTTTYYSGEYSKEYLIKRDDLLITMDGEFKISGWNGEDALLNQRVCKIETKSDDLLNKYLHYLLPKTLKDIEHKTPFVTVKHLSVKKINEIKLILPSIAEQELIIKILDEADALRRKRKQAIELIDDYIDSIFFDMFLLKAESGNIQLIQLEKIATKITDGVHLRPTYTESGIPFISVKNVTKKKLDFDNCKFVSVADHQKHIKACKPEMGDILYTKVGATYGRACVVDVSREFSLYVSVALIKPNKDKVLPNYLKSVMNSRYVKHQADRSVKGAGVPDLHLIEIKSFKIPLPTIEEQNKFILVVQEAETLKQKMLSQSEELENQFQALMQKAFNGKL